MKHIIKSDKKIILTAIILFILANIICVMLYNIMPFVYNDALDLAYDPENVEYEGFSYDYEKSTYKYDDKASEHYITLKTIANTSKCAWLLNVTPEMDIPVDVIYFDSNANTLAASQEVWMDDAYVFSIEGYPQNTSQIRFSFESPIDIDIHRVININPTFTMRKKLIVAYELVAIVILAILLFVGFSEKFATFYTKRAISFKAWLVTRITLIRNMFIAGSASLIGCVLIAGLLCDFNNSQLQFETTILLFGISLAAEVCIYYRKSFLNNIEKIGFFLVMLTGTMYVLILPAHIWVSFDDQVHYSHVSNIISNLTHRRTLEDNIMLTAYDNVHTYERENMDGDGTNEEMNCYSSVADLNASTPIAYENISVGSMSYIPSVIGVLFAKGINAPYIWLLRSGKWFNLLFLAIIAYFAMRRLKAGKQILLLLILVPEFMFVSSNYTYDTWLVAFSVLVAAYIFSEYQRPDERITKSCILIIAISIILANIAKPVYFLIALLALFIPVTKFESRKSSWIYRAIITFSMMLPFVYVFITNILQAGIGDTRGGEEVNATAQISYIHHHFLAYACTLIDYLMIYLNPFLSTLRWGIGWQDFFYNDGPVGIGITVTLILIIVALSSTWGSCENYSTFYKIMVFCVYVATGAICATSMYVVFTSVGSDHISGAQGRYLMPILFPTIYILIRLPRSKASLIEKVGENNVACFGCIAMVLLNAYAMAKFYLG